MITVLSPITTYTTSMLPIQSRTPLPILKEPIDLQNAGRIENLASLGTDGSFYSVAFSPDGQILAGGSWDKSVKLWRVIDRSLLQTLQGHTEPMTTLAFSPDGQMQASGSKEGTIQLCGVYS
jgi:WD40 repeat protein